MCVFNIYLTLSLRSWHRRELCCSSSTVIAYFVENYIYIYNYINCYAKLQRQDD